MNISKVSSFFDRTPMWCAYTGKKLAARCQVVAWDSPRRDGLTTVRRTLYIDPKYKLPKRHAVIVSGNVWILSETENVDSWGRYASRRGYVAQYASLGKAASTAEVSEGLGTDVYMSRVWVKDVKDIVNTSESQGQYYIYFVKGEPLHEGEFAFVDGRWHIIRNIVSGTAGLMIAECNELEPDCLIDVEVIKEGEYDPVTETYSDEEPEVIKAILLDWRDDYYHNLPTREPEQIGDRRLRISSKYDEHIQISTQLKISGVVYQVVSIEIRPNRALSVAIRRV